MRNVAFASLVLLVATGGSALAQTDLGLDLTEDPKKDEPKKDEPAKEDGLDLTAPTPTTPPPSKTPASPAANDKAPGKKDTTAVERDITQDDRVKSVQRKLYMKRGRFELAPYFAINVNDPFYTKLGGAIRAAFYPHDTLAVSVRFTLLNTLPTEDVRTAKRNFNSRIFYSVPFWTAMGDVEWSPIYGKVAIFNSILHFDGYLVGGAGIVFTETTPADDPLRSGVKPAFDMGVGFRFVTKDWLAVNVALINTAYVDVPTGSAKGSTQNIMLVHAGVSIFFPFKSTFREAE
ncbi:MAG: outer membrane beta-barrel domain-containing protein [Myxococcota bacterium]